MERRMKKDNIVLSLAFLSAVLAVSLGCGQLSRFTKGTDTASASNSGTSNASGPSTTASNSSSTTTTTAKNVEKADFSMTSEQLDLEYTRKGVTDKDLEKYENKTIAVTGRVSMLVKEKQDTVQPWVTLAAPGLGHGVNCYFDDENVGQIGLLKEGAMVKVQGYQDNFIVPEISPMLKNCVVLEGAK